LSEKEELGFLLLVCDDNRLPDKRIIYVQNIIYRQNNLSAPQTPHAKESSGAVSANAHAAIATPKHIKQKIANERWPIACFFRFYGWAIARAHRQSRPGQQQALLFQRMVSKDRIAMLLVSRNDAEFNNVHENY
jgi:hypothetical protein